MQVSPEFREALLQLPAAEPPVGVKADFDNPDNLNYVGIRVVTVCLILTAIVVLMRLYTRVWVVGKMSLDDYFLLLALLIHVGAMTPISFMLINLPMGIHQWNLRIGDAFNHAYLFYCSGIIYGVELAVLKVAILLTYKGAFVPTGIRNYTYWIIHGLIGFNVIYYTIFTFLGIFSCTPRNKRWDVTVEGHCMDHHAIMFSTAVINTVSDILLAILPQVVIWRLKMSLKRRAGISLLFVIGIFGCACAAIRIWCQVKLSSNLNDQTYLVVRLFLWSIAELACGFLVISLPVMPKFIAAVRDTPLVTKIETALGSHSNKSNSQASPANVSGQKHSFTIQKQIVTDIDFQELVVGTLRSHNSEKSRT